MPRGAKSAFAFTTTGFSGASAGPSLASLQAGEGDVVAHDAEQVAAYRAADGSLSLCSAKSTHMGCIESTAPSVAKRLP
jgi:hypothetical protein